MIQNALTEIGGVGIFGAISVCLFVFVFTVALVWAARQKRAFLESMETLPLNDGTLIAGQKGAQPHED